MVCRTPPQLPAPIAREAVAATVRFGWLEKCQIELDEYERPNPPRLDSAPAVYRLRFELPQRHEAWYIGETRNLNRRFGTNYRSNHANRHGQKTNWKIIESIRNTCLFDGHVFLDVVTQPVLITDNEEKLLDLRWESARLFVEAAAISVADSTGQIMLLNHSAEANWAELSSTRFDAEYLRESPGSAGEWL